MTSVLAFVVVLGIVIFVHELGHLLAAKAVGIGAPRFSIGFGPPTPLRFHWGETEFVVSWVPLGGYVKMATREEEGGTSAIEGGDAANFPPHRLFENKPLWARAVVLSAGVLMNGVLAWGIYTGLAASGRITVDPITILAAADPAGLPPEAESLTRVPFRTQILYINGDTVASWNDVHDALLDPGEDQLRFDFAGGVPPVIVRIPGTRLDARAKVYEALQPYQPAQVGTVTGNSAAQRAGLRVGDVIARINADTVRYWGEMVRLLRRSPGQPVWLTVARGDTVLSLPATPAAREVRDPLTGARDTIGYLGIGPALKIQTVELTLPQAVTEGWRETVGAVRMVIATLKGLILGQVSPKELAGPIGIGQLAGQAARAGPVFFLSLIAFISANLAVFNLLPIPVLDGGHLVFLVAEGALGRPVSRGIRLRLTQIGMALLLALVVLVTYNDLLRLFGVR